MRVGENNFSPLISGISWVFVNGMKPNDSEVLTERDIDFISVSRLQINNDPIIP
jgi:hypothetical protein